ncbi:hypothetical protein A2914_02580 [Candidatus Nomurabacteria bacterium RIFCSPLOWO2_01_FULL_41_21]|uniref:Endolytic murein transglycosylase n=2 Tax=Candidatus Nomuraibacteriota TaxID=1752729 RepID=A0A1F6V1S5_9BACT|nr:MAG: hypothetical protein A2733_01735 [Candidatus Nomurabacteria bacterium RIFCSPHIGHO2_01_FULL_40_20]OGI88549.1 MAG: hypothetical protein A2914_02580 [Candidatus Nomurabacteria bacterium RIFCSPLOWO2_01_FULL_41_21]
MKYKYILISALLLVGIMFSVVIFYRLDPAVLTRLSFYVDLANPRVKVVQVREGLRKEEVAEVVGEKLGWDDTEKQDFLKIHLAYNSADHEGRYFPKTYLIDKNEEPLEVSAVMLEEFEKQTEKIEESSEASKKIDGETALKIASIIQREAGGKGDMRLISGIIWNRINKGMKLQLDATLQYAKGSVVEGWWPRVRPEDKKIKSDYNTYLFKGLPPGAIANPGPDALLAAYHPQKTDCLFYLHDKKRKIHCSKTYEEHKNKIAIYY